MIYENYLQKIDMPC